MRDHLLFSGVQDSVPEEIKKHLNIGLNTPQRKATRQLVFLDSAGHELKFHACKKDGAKPYCLEPTHNSLRWALIAFYDENKTIEFIIYPVRPIKSDLDRKAKKMSPEALLENAYEEDRFVLRCNLDVLPSHVENLRSQVASKRHGNLRTEVERMSEEDAIEFDSELLLSETQEAFDELFLTAEELETLHNSVQLPLDLEDFLDKEMAEAQTIEELD